MSNEFRLMSESGSGERHRKIWLCALGRGGTEWNDCKENGFACLGWDELGDLMAYSTRAEMERKLVSMQEEGGRVPKNASLACWQFAHEIKRGDAIVAKKGLHKLLGIGRVTGGYQRNEGRDGYKNILHCEWVKCNEMTSVSQLPMKTLTDISSNQELLCSIFSNYGLSVDTLEPISIPIEPDDVNTEDGEAYTRNNFLSEAFMSEEEHEHITRLLMTKKNIIFQGAPGVGKTFVAKRFAASIIGADDPKHIEFVQFHQSYSYEDFIGGYKPSGNGFEYRNGVFYDFCLKARKDPQGKYFFIIDEINRGNLSKIFGELLMLIEADKREEEVRLAYTRESFVVPDNVYLIGMMNTADRSLAMIDYALRRRFSFVTMEPKFMNDKFKEMMARKADAKRDALVACVIRLNEAIRNDSGLGKGFEIGHSYFCGGLPPADIVEFELIPLLEEYWYDASEKVGEWTSKLREAVR